MRANELYQIAYEVAKKAGKSEAISHASGYVALNKAGYHQDTDGKWFKPGEGSFAFTAEITKSDEEKRIVYGWASVIEKAGKQVVDHQGDSISAHELTNAAHNFIKSSRMAKMMHEGDSVGEFVESMVFTTEVQKALGIDLGQVGWFVGMKVHDERVWKKVKDGGLKMFSIGGSAKRIDNGS